jgi:predicted DNA-binding transcriptional regulator YafY
MGYSKKDAGKDTGHVNKRIRLLRVLDILNDTDETCPMNADSIIFKLQKEYGISCDRKTISSDVKVLQEGGYDVMQKKYSGTSVSSRGWYMNSRHFSDWEIKVLIDAVAASNFLSKPVSDELIGKLLEETNSSSRDLIKDDMPPFSYHKTKIEGLDDTIEKIILAIKQKKRISFKYQDISPDGTPVYRPGEKGKPRVYEVNPYSTVWLDQFYYMICNTPKYSNLSSYRLDRMKDVQVSDTDRTPATQAVDNFCDTTIQDFIRTSIKQYTGSSTPLTVKYSGSNINALIDIFGSENVHKVGKEDDGLYSILTSYNDGLFFTLLSIGEKIEIIEPKFIRDEYIRRLDDIRSTY